MRSDMNLDQAEGLRRLLVNGNTKVVTLVAGKSGVGRTSLAVNLAATMVHCGKKVWILDENHAPRNLLVTPKLHVDFDFLDVAQGKCKPTDALLNIQGFSILSTARAMRSFCQFQRKERLHLENTLAEMSRGVEVFLVDARMPVLKQGGGGLTKVDAVPDLVKGASMLVVADATAGGITDSYALIKRLVTENPSVKIEFVVNKVTHEKMAMTVFNNMAKVAWSNLAVRLDYAGSIPFDKKSKPATQLNVPVDGAFPVTISANPYLALSKKLLGLPLRQTEVEHGAPTVMKSLMGYVSGPMPQHSTIAVHTS